MKVFYKAEKNFTPLENYTDLRFGIYTVRAYLWQFQDALLENVRAEDPNTAAAYIPMPERVHGIANQIGEFHLCQEVYSLGYIEHEFVHMSIDILKNFSMDEELLAAAMGEAMEQIVREFTEPLTSE